MKKLLPALLALLALLGGVQARSPRGGPAPAGLPSIAGLHIVGNRILNSSGQAVQLRGVDYDGTEYMCLDGNSGDIWDPTATGRGDAKLAPNQASIDVLKTWGINAVRLPLNESCWLGINGATTGGSTYTTSIATTTDLFISNGIAVIWDLQWVGPGTTRADGQACSGSQFEPVPDLDHAPAFWTSAANLAKTRPSVLLDLYNEPWPDGSADSPLAWTILHDGASITSCTPNYTSVGTQSLVNTIRGTGATNIIMVPGVGFTNLLTHWLDSAYRVTDSLNQIAASWHSYAVQTCAPMSCWTSVVQPVLNQVPVVTGEIGENDCQGTFVDPLMNWGDTVALNYVAWAWNTYDCNGFPAVISDTDGTPTGFGVEIRNHYLNVAGLPIPPTPPETFFSNVYPFGLAVGRNSDYTAADTTIYHQDGYIQAGSGTFTVAPGLQENMQFFQPYSTADTITGTPDPALYQTGRQGQFGIWIINVPNGNYFVTEGFAPDTGYSLTGTNATDPWGQDQSIQGAQVGTCVWTSFSASNPYMDTLGGITGGSGYTDGTYNNIALTGGSGSGARGQIVVSGGAVTRLVVTTTGTGYLAGDTLSAPAASIGGTGSGFSAVVQSLTACPGSSQAVPALDVAITVTYTVSVFNGQLRIQNGASFGGGRLATLKSIKVAIAP